MCIDIKQYIFLFIILLLPLSLEVLGQQVVLTEDFEDENLSMNPEWTGDIEDFSFFDDGANTLLRLNAGGAGSSVITTPSTVAYGSWEFFIDQDFAPSNSNRSYIFLISDIANLSGNVNGYAVRAGASGSNDRFRLIRFTDGSETEILEGSVDLSGGGPFQIRVERDDSGEWRLYESAGYGSEPVLSGTAVENTHTRSDYFGLNLNYTSTRSDLFYFDDISIENSEPFYVTSVSVEGATKLEVSFNYPLDFTTADPASFELNNGAGQPVVVSEGSGVFSALLTYPNSLDPGNYILGINSIDNIYGGAIPPNTEIGFSVNNPFSVVSVNPVTASRIAVEFTEQPDESTWTPSNFRMSPVAGGDPITPVSIDYSETGFPKTLFLVLSDPLSVGDYTLAIQNNGSSRNGWPIAGDTSFNFKLENPFFVTDLEIISRSEFAISFSQNVQTADRSNFEISGFGSPDNIQQPAPDIVSLSYDSPVEVGDREMIISDVMSDQDWEIEASTTIEFALFDEFSNGDLAITEFFYRVPVSWRTTTFDRPQYVEIYNRSEKLLNLRDFTISGNKISEDSDLPIGPGEYLVIARGSSVFLE
jgi:hypothetical protein